MATNQDMRSICSLIFYIMTCVVLQIYTCHIQCTSTRYLYNALHTCAMRCTVLVISFISLTLLLLDSQCPFIFGRYLFLSVSSFLIFPFSNFPSSSLLCFSNILSVFSPIISSSIAIFRSFLGNEFGNSTQDSGLKIKIDVVLYEEHNDGRKALG